MRAFIAALLSAAVFADTKTKPAGGYNYNQGGVNWGTYYPDLANNVCGDATKKEQSPINIVTANVVEDKDLDIVVSGLGSNAVEPMDYATANHEVNWHFNFGSWKDTASVTRTDGTTKVETFKPVQVHVHTPSENTVDGKHYAMEAHLVSQGANGDYAVVGYFFDNVGQDVENDWVKSFLNGFTARNNSDEETQPQIDMELIERKVIAEEGIWQFKGSFTTPPCTEGVRWTVYKSVQPISTAQLTAIKEFTQGSSSVHLEATYKGYLATNTANEANIGGNNRKVQLLNDRKVYFSTSETTKNDVENISTDDDESDAASTMMASAFTAAAVTFLSF